LMSSIKSALIMLPFLTVARNSFLNILNSETLVYIKWDTGVWVYERKLFGKLKYNTCQ
jgi:hypothetical protein